MFNRVKDLVNKEFAHDKMNILQSRSHLIVQFLKSTYRLVAPLFLNTGVQYKKGRLMPAL